ncbi:MAG: ECF transporter S component [Coriobacteriales bacterium]|nr:ECF transporter S component [Coriobacteriales bacterium]
MLAIVEPAVLILVPIALLLCALFATGVTTLLTFVVAVVAIVPFFARFERGGMRPRDIMPVVVLAALAVASRMVFALLPNSKPFSAIIIVAGACFGKRSGFMVGALAALVSNMFFGQGPWTPWQMYLFGMMGYMAGVLASRGWLKKPWVGCLYGAVATLLFGILFDTYFVVAYLHAASWQSALVGYAGGLPFNVMHTVSTVVFLALIYAPWTSKLTRIKAKYGIV